MGGLPELHAVRLAIARSRARLRASFSHEDVRLLELELRRLVAKREQLMAHAIGCIIDALTAGRVALRQADSAAIVLAQHSLDMAMSFDNADFGDIQLYDEALGGLVILAHRNFSREVLPRFSLITSGDGTSCARSLRNDSIVLVDDVSRDPEFSKHRDAVRLAGFRAVQSYPLHRRDGRQFGVISTHFCTPHEFRSDDVERMWKFAASVEEDLEKIIFRDA